MASDEFTYYFSEEAENDLDEILRYISVVLENPEAASSFLSELEQRIAILCTFPESGAIVNNEFLLRPDVRKIIVESYIIYYLIDIYAARIILLRIVYGKRNQNLIFGDL